MERDIYMERDEMDASRVQRVYRRKRDPEKKQETRNERRGNNKNAETKEGSPKNEKRGENALIHRRRHIDLCEGHLGRELGERRDVHELAEELGRDDRTREAEEH
jgi:hypothetical protein